MSFSIQAMEIGQTLFIPPYVLEAIEESINEQFPIDDDIEILYSNHCNSDSYWLCELRYNHPQYKKQSITRKFFSREELESMLHEVARIYYNQQHCNHPENAVGRLYYNNRPFPDGKAICHNCNLYMPEHFPPLDNGTCILGDMFGKHYVTQYDWRDTSIQKGDDGVVISQDSDNYRTAFFEAFPTIGGTPTFIRGEGSNVEEAEAQCWHRYETQSQCPEHEFTRWQGKRYRKDGFGTCIHCGFSTSKALEPETLCSICSTPTTRTLQEHFYCTEHYFEQPLESHLNDATDHQSILLMDANRSETRIKAYIDYYIEKSYFDCYGADIYNERERQLERISHHFFRVFCKNVYDLHPFDDRMDEFDFPDEHDPLLNRMLAFCSGNMDRIIRMIDLKVDVPSMLFFSFDILEEQQSQ